MCQVDERIYGSLQICFWRFPAKRFKHFQWKNLLRPGKCLDEAFQSNLTSEGFSWISFPANWPYRNMAMHLSQFISHNYHYKLVTSNVAMHLVRKKKRTSVKASCHCRKSRDRKCRQYLRRFKKLLAILTCYIM